MGDHFWPSIYPCIAVGLLYGFALGGWKNAMLGAVGGLVASYLAFFFFTAFFSQDGMGPLAILLALSLAGAVVVTKGVGLIMGVRGSAKD
jgi:hypothetical protein